MLYNTGAQYMSGTRHTNDVYQADVHDKISTNSHGHGLPYYLKGITPILAELV